MPIVDILKQIKHEPHKFGWFIGYDKLIPLHSGWIKQLWDSPGSHALMAFRGSFKTTSCCTVGIVRYLLFNPNARIFIIRKTFTEANKIIAAVSKIFDKPETKDIFRMAHGIEPVKIKDGGGVIDFNFRDTMTPETSIVAYGIGTAITGAHADVIICDDIIGLEDRTSRAERDGVKEHIREIAGNVIDPGATLIFLGTKWAENDGWDVIEEFTEVKKYPASKYNFFPPGEIEAKMKRLTPFLAAINYELEITADESLMFQQPRYGPFDMESWRTMPVTAHLDCAYGGEDTCALTIAAGKQMTGFLHEGHIQHWYETVASLYRRYHCREILLETNSDKGYVAKDLRGLGLNARTYAERDNKAVKISCWLYGAWGDIIWGEETDPNYMNQILDYKPGSGAHDDAPDSAASLLRAVSGNAPLTERTRAALFG